ncbi:2215_t:CDS:2 [Funneliformis geosporum]|uniref:2215_t:CDS:1 n=1 Tax=Funneliformis geosporum TaxID=1117311 RepID=A0A9W4SQY3_9GLOM|nr:2215_t:CDS:2 [Funneliformis geosporum]
MDQNSNLNLGHDFMEIVESSVSPVKSYASHDDMEIVENDLKKIFEEIDNICLTCNTWMSKEHGIIAITANWISNTYKPQEAFLTLEEIDFPFTSITIKEKIKEIIHEWNISNKVSFITTENAACMIEAIKLLGEEFNVERIPCVSHTLQLVIAKAMNINQNMQIFILRVKRLVYFFSSPKHLDSLIKAQEALHYTRVYKKVKEIPTKWNSSFYSWEKLLILRRALTYLCNEKISNQNKSESRNDEDILNNKSIMNMLMEDDVSSDEEEVNEIDIYLKIKANRNIMPLYWWENSENQFPFLSKIAKEYLAISVTSTNSSEHSFSSLARIIEKRYPLDEYYFLQKNSNLLEIF